MRTAAVHRRQAKQLQQSIGQSRLLMSDASGGAQLYAAMDCLTYDDHTARYRSTFCLLWYLPASLCCGADASRALHKPPQCPGVPWAVQQLDPMEAALSPVGSAAYASAWVAQHVQHSRHAVATGYMYALSADYNLLFRQ